MITKTHEEPLVSTAANWIWFPGLTGHELDTRVRFRREFQIPAIASSEPISQDEAIENPSGFDSYPGPRVDATLRIAADSRYILVVNGIEIGSGPPRHWPTHRPLECYEVGGVLRSGSNIIEIMVHSIGTSTSSYIPGRGGLLVEMTVSQRDTDEEDRRFTIGTDESWDCRLAVEYSSGPPRINVSQPFVERYDERRVDEGLWRAAEIVGPADPGVVIGPMGAPSRRIGETAVEPHFESMAAYSWRTTIREDWRVHHVASIARSVCLPLFLSVDFREAYFPGDITTEDRLQVGAIAIAIDSDSSQAARVIRKNRRWPYERERIWVNGVRHVIDKQESECAIRLAAGTNLLLCDVSGAYQRFWLDLVVQGDKSDVRLGYLDPISSKSVVAVGPFDSAAIGNIVCSDGFSVEIEQEDYLAVQKCADVPSLERHSRWLRPIDDSNICTDNAKLLMEHRTRRIDKRISWHGTSLAVDPYDEITIDFGDEVSGYLELDLEIPRGYRVDGVCYEYHRHEGAELPDDLNNWFRYTSNGKRSIFKSVLRRGFRYLTLAFYPETAPNPPEFPDSVGDRIEKGDSPSVRIHAIRCHERLFPTAEVAEFECSDRRLTEIFSMSRRTVSLCMEDTYVDCPGFEQALWIGDTRNTALLSYVLFGAYGVARRSLIVAAHSLQRSELPESHGPSGVPLVLTAWALLWMIAVREYVVHSGDTSIVPDVAPWLVDAAAGIHRHINRDGLLEISAWNMLDWADMDTPYHGIVAHQNMLAVWALRETAALLRDNQGAASPATVEQMLDNANTIAAAVNTHLWDPSRGAYRDSIHADGALSSVFSVQTNVIALLSGVAPDGHWDHLFHVISAPPTEMVPIGSPFMSFFLYRLLVDRSQEDASRVISDIKARWGEMIDEGSTTCWETFRGFYTERLTRSYCHAWSAAPAWYLPEVILGIKRTADGWRRVAVDPDGSRSCKEITWARGSVMTPHGPVRVSWRRKDDGEVEASTVLPPGVSMDG